MKSKYQIAKYDFVGGVNCAKRNLNTYTLIKQTLNASLRKAKNTIAYTSIP